LLNGECSMIVLGIDPGIAIVGYGIIDYIGNKFKVFRLWSYKNKI
jgi:hypothetical protein